MKDISTASSSTSFKCLHVIIVIVLVMSLVSLVLMKIGKGLHIAISFYNGGILLFCGFEIVSLQVHSYDI